MYYANNEVHEPEKLKWWYWKDKKADDFNWTIMRYKGNRKMFAAIYEHLGNIWINVKCDPNLTSDMS